MNVPSLPLNKPTNVEASPKEASLVSHTKGPELVHPSISTEAWNHAADSSCGTVPLNLATIHHPIAQELAEVESIIQSEIRTETPWVDRLLEHNWIQGGKRIRPMLLLLSGAASGGLTPGHCQLAAAIELIHAATLVHDDVIDKAEMRRHLPSVNATFDNRASVLLGDFLFTHAFYVASRAGNVAAIKAIARSSNRVCEGEIRQNAWQGNFDLEESEYLGMIEDKTGELCACSCFVGAMLAGADLTLCDSFADYGMKLGVAFQIIDDVLDLIGHQPKVGKTLGTDLSNQKLTLPILHCLRSSSASNRVRLIERLKTNSVDLPEMKQHLLKTGSLDYAFQTAQRQLSEALCFAQSLPPSAHSTSLEELVFFVLKRSH